MAYLRQQYKIVLIFFILIAYCSGSVLGLIAIGLSLLDIGVVLDWFYQEMPQFERLVVITTTMLTFGMGASLQALLHELVGVFLPMPQTLVPTW